MGKLLTIALCLLLASCGISRKSSTSTQTFYDSSLAENEVVENRRVEKSTSSSQEEQRWSNEVQLQFDPVELARELAGPQDTTPAKVHRIKVNGQQVESSLPIKSATIKLDGQTKTLQLEEQHTADSQATQQSRKAQVVAALEANKETKFSWKPVWIIYLLLAGLGAAICWYLYEHYKANS